MLRALAAQLPHLQLNLAHHQGRGILRGHTGLQVLRGRRASPQPHQQSVDGVQGRGGLRDDRLGQGQRVAERLALRRGLHTERVIDGNRVVGQLARCLISELIAGRSLQISSAAVDQGILLQFQVAGQLAQDLGEALALGFRLQAAGGARSRAGGLGQLGPCKEVDAAL